MPATGFSGFSDETLAFLNGLKANNSRDWFDANRKSYEAAVKAPSKAFSILTTSSFTYFDVVP